MATQETLVVKDEAPAETKVTDLEHATVSDLADSLKKMANGQPSISETIILK